MSELPIWMDEKGLNMAIGSKILPDEQMRALGFTDHQTANWYWVKNLGHEVSLNVTIPKDGSRLSIDVLDEWYLQPYDYQAIHSPIADRIAVKVDRHLAELQEAGVITGFVPGMYV